MDNNDFFYEEESFIDLGKYWNILRRHWKTALWFCIGGFVLGCLVALGTPRKYTVVSKLAPELSSTATNRLSSMASLVGLSANMMGTTDAVYPMVYPEILKSPDFVADLFETPVSFNWKKERIDTTLYGYLTDFQKNSPIGHLISLPLSVASKAQGFFNDSEEESGNESVNPYHFTKAQGRVARIIGKSISAEIDKKTMVLTISVSLQDAEVCAELSNAVNGKLKQYVTAYRTEKAVNDCEYYESLNDDAQRQYDEAQKQYSRYSDTHQNVTLHSNMIESERLRNEVSLKYQLYMSTAQQLQAAKARVQQETPVFAEIIKPTVPLKSSNSRKKTAMEFSFLGLVAGMLFMFYKYRKEDL